MVYSTLALSQNYQYFFVEKVKHIVSEKLKTGGFELLIKTICCPFDQ